MSTPHEVQKNGTQQMFVHCVQEGERESMDILPHLLKLFSAEHFVSSRHKIDILLKKALRF